jgi:hypothetical protein
MMISIGIDMTSIELFDISKNTSNMSNTNTDNNNS